MAAPTTRHLSEMISGVSFYVFNFSTSTKSNTYAVRRVDASRSFTTKSESDATMQRTLTYPRSFSIRTNINSEVYRTLSLVRNCHTTTYSMTTISSAYSKLASHLHSSLAFISRIFKLRINDSKTSIVFLQPEREIRFICIED